ncbi:MAG: ornithine carbamoyltransferase [Kofleriaceae bacterium]|nr:ornithine carbamoyltransferase [Myxococcales bacterium]MCB9563506.1 ornithine carbamoyltransferase [Kofleriaceae bacterium]MCB9574728.1 ornithine carbamoyltransferase [Kofleriaceae bacterium]
MTAKRDFLTLADVPADAWPGLWRRAGELKAARARGERITPLAGKSVALIFEKASTRTRVSFEVGVFDLGGHAVVLSAQGSQIARGEPIEDTARVLSGYCHAIVLRTFGQARVATLAKWATVPVINGLTDEHHPCQVASDLFTVIERHGRIDGLRYAWIGDGNNMAASWIEAAGLFGLDLTLACPQGFTPDAALVAEARARQGALGRGTVTIVDDPRAAAAGADVVSTDVWASMGQEEEAEARRRAFAGYCVDAEVMAAADPGAIVLHCLPAHRGEEISGDVLDGPQSAAWQQAENRMHVQKALLERLVG